MISPAELRASSRAYLRAARVLNRAGSNSADAAAYLCGYAIEIALKVRICRALDWAAYPDTPSEFKGYASFKTHDLDVLLHLSGAESAIKTDALLTTAWSVVQGWNPEQRYQPVGTRTGTDAKEMIEATATLLRRLL